MYCPAVPSCFLSPISGANVSIQGSFTSESILSHAVPTRGGVGGEGTLDREACAVQALFHQNNFVPVTGTS